MLALFSVQLENIPGIRLAQVKSIEVYETGKGIYCYLDLESGESYEVMAKIEKKALEMLHLAIRDALKSGDLDLSCFSALRFRHPD